MITRKDGFFSYGCRVRINSDLYCHSIGSTWWEKDNTGITLLNHFIFLFCFFEVFVGPMSILWGYRYPLFRTSDDSSHEFQSRGGSIVTCALLHAMIPRVISGCRERASNPDRALFFRNSTTAINDLKQCKIYKRLKILKQLKLFVHLHLQNNTA